MAPKRVRKKVSEALGARAATPQPAPTTATADAVDKSDVIPAAARTPTPSTPTPSRGEPEKIALMHDGSRFLVDRMQKATVERFRTLIQNSPDLLDGAGGGVPAELSIDLSDWIGQGYSLLFGGVALLLVKTKRIAPTRAVAFVPTDDDLSKLVPLTEKAIDQQFGAKIRNLPPMAALGLSVLGVVAAMYQRAASDVDLGDRRAS